MVIIWSNQHTSQLSHPRTKKAKKNLKLFTAKATRRFTQHAAEWPLKGKKQKYAAETDSGKEVSEIVEGSIHFL